MMMSAKQSFPPSTNYFEPSGPVSLCSGQALSQAPPPASAHCMAPYVPPCHASPTNAAASATTSSTPCLSVVDYQELLKQAQLLLHSNVHFLTPSSSSASWPAIDSTSLPPPPMQMPFPPSTTNWGAPFLPQAQMPIMQGANPPLSSFQVLSQGQTARPSSDKIPTTTVNPFTRIEPNPLSGLPVWKVSHSTETPEGACFKLKTLLPDPSTHLVGIYSTRENAEKAARSYVFEVLLSADRSCSNQLDTVDWEGEGWLKEERRISGWSCDERVFIEKYLLDEIQYEAASELQSDATTQEGTKESSEDDDDIVFAED